MKPIWTTIPDIATINGEFIDNTMLKTIGLEIVEFTEDSIVGTLPVDERTVQPYGLLHGGATAALAETLGSLASQFVMPDPVNDRVVGIELNINHLGSATEGIVTGVVTPVKIGRRLHVWQIDISREDGKAVSRARLTVMVL